MLKKCKEKAAVIFVALSAMVAGQAHAVLPADQAAGYTAIGDLVTDHEAAAWVIVISVTVAVIAIGLFKKFTKKSAS